MTPYRNPKKKKKREEKGRKKRERRSEVTQANVPPGDRQNSSPGAPVPRRGSSGRSEEEEMSSIDMIRDHTEGSGRDGKLNKSLKKKDAV